MRAYTKECFGSKLEVIFLSEQNRDSLVAESFSLIDDFEHKYSRFIPGNTLSQINTQKQGTLPHEIITLILLAQKVSKMTQGYFDITLLPVLENKGYGIEADFMSEGVGYENVVCSGNNIRLNNDVLIEFGSFGKGYALDLIYNHLISDCQDFVINFGGDIRVAGNKTIYLENPDDAQKNIGSINIKNASIASSAGNKRKLAEGHHLINPKEKKSQDDKIAVYVTHKLGVFADIFATALFVTPLDLSLKVLEKTPDLEALIIASDGKIYKSSGFNCTLNI